VFVCRPYLELFWDVVKAVTPSQLRVAYDKLEVINPEAVKYLKVGRCRLLVSKPELKARPVSALETKM
jgi:hypothetical protein